MFDLFLVWWNKKGILLLLLVRCKAANLWHWFVHPSVFPSVCRQVTKILICSLWCELLTLCVIFSEDLDWLREFSLKSTNIHQSGRNITLDRGRTQGLRLLAPLWCYAKPSTSLTNISPQVFESLEERLPHEGFVSFLPPPLFSTANLPPPLGKNSVPPASLSHCPPSVCWCVGLGGLNE